MNQALEKNRSALTPRGQRTRAALIAAAEQVFGEHGFERASIVDITQAAGVAQGTFYIYFKDKTTLFRQLVDDLGRLLRDALDAAIHGLNDRIDIERAGLRAFFEFCRDHRNLYRIIRQAEFVDEQAYRNYYRTLARGYVEGLRRAMAKGQIREADPECIAYALMGIADFLGMRWILWERNVDVEDLVNEAIGFIEGGLKKGPRRAPQSGTHAPSKRRRR